MYGYSINRIQDGRPKKAPRTSLFPVISTNVGIIPQNFLTLNFNPFSTFTENVKAISSAGPKLLNLNQDYFSKKRFFWPNLYKIEVFITFLIKMLELPKILLIMSWIKIMAS